MPAKTHSEPPAESIFRSAYPELTVPALVLGLIIGVIMTASMTYVGMKIGFTVPGSPIAAILGFGVLRGVLRRKSIVENNLNQTIASGVNVAAAGVIFTVPALYILGVDMTPEVIMELGFAAVAGGLLGVAFIIPIRKQMIDIDRLRFPSGTAVAAILKSPGAGVYKAKLMVGGVLVSTLVSVYFAWFNPLSSDPLYWPGVLQKFGVPSYVDGAIAVSLLAFGAGFLSGKMGLTTTIGGILAYWIIAPASVQAGWIDPASTGSEVRNLITKPIGIGMLVGGAMMGIVLAFPAIRAAFGTLKASSKAGDDGGPREELPVWVLNVAAVVGFFVLMAATWMGSDGAVGPVRIVLVAVVGSLWLWLAGVVVSQCAGMTDWSPVSGMALVAVTLMLLLTGEHTVASVCVGAAVAVSIALAADMMSDLKTGHLVGAMPIRQQVAQLMSTWVGPVVSLFVLSILSQKYIFGSPELAAPQAQALAGAIESIKGADVPIDKYVGGLCVGAALSSSGIAGLGVLVGLSMYLPAAYIIYPYGLGCVVNIVVRRLKGARWADDVGIPIAAGLIVGESITMLVHSFHQVFKGG